MKSISFRLVAAMLGIGFAGMALLTGITTVFAVNALISESLSAVQEKTERSAESIDAWLSEQTTYISVIARDLAAVPDIPDDTLYELFQAHLREKPEYNDLYIGRPDDTAVFASGWVPDDDWIASQREWYAEAGKAPGKPYITQPYTDAMTGELCVSISQTVSPTGTEKGVVANDMYVTVLAAIVTSTNIGQDSYAFLTNGGGDILIHPDSAYRPDADDNFQNLGSVDGGVYAPLVNRGNAEAPVKLRDTDGVECFFANAPIGATGWYFYTSIPARVVYGPIYSQIAAAVIMSAIVLVFMGIFIYVMVKKIVVRPVLDVTRAATVLSKGETDIDLSSRYVGEIALLADSFINMTRNIREQSELLSTISDGDYTVSIPMRSEKDIMNQALNAMVAGSSGMLQDIRLAAGQVDTGSQQIAQASHNLATGASQQASTLEAFTAAITELRSMADDSTKIAEQTLENVSASSGLMDECTGSMNQMLDAMRSIDDKSKDISKVIKVIDDIAFQTNILALNAAVEAARAGQQGRGFAVVADEVRNLASKSAEAAKETADLIAGSSLSVSEGNAIVGKVNESLQAVSANSGRNAQFIENLHSSSQRQSKSMAEVTAAIIQLSSVVQANSATAEETAASSEEMSAQAATLSQIVSRFKLKPAGSPEIQRRPGTAFPPGHSRDEGFALSGGGDKY
ncbi:methyl-accepting chemotaxis protein [Clostridia bacterium]|nr:methyl-accepting chemotaxis protein [Clostridia bacterium]